MKLTPKQKAFCDYYIETGNATEAAIKAGYSEKAARAIGSENLTKPAIKLYISKQMANKDKERIASQEEVLEFLTKAMRGEIMEEIITTEKGEIVRIEKKPALKDRVKAAELLGKRYSLFTENIKLSGNIGVQIIDDIS